ncbi:hypothetical protein Zmor_020419 [Zophobas morio]|uniref:Uncharacterized protein n=1 Tax=Zophobas morio TaxID=2755281 RepID=A0AA38I6S7_9CUCU|nr:hypothetical protein Zmor_020419 [Zophobas morio]
MLLTDYVPFWLQCVFRAFGILQIDTKWKVVAKIVPIPFWCYYFGNIIKVLCTFDVNVYIEFTNISQYVDDASKIIVFISMGTNLVLYYKRNIDLVALIDKITKIPIKTRNKLTEHSHYLVLVFLAFFNLILISSTGFLTDFGYQMFFYLPLLVSSLDNVFLSFILEDLRQKFKVQ